MSIYSFILYDLGGVSAMIKNAKNGGQILPAATELNTVLK